MRVFPVSLRTARLTLRQPNDDDARLEHEMILESLDHLWPWFSFRADPPTLAERVDLAARQRADAAAGTGVTYMAFAGDRAVGKVRALLHLAFELGIKRVEAHTDTDNASSRALAERAGFVLGHIQPDAYDRPDGVRRPECVYVAESA